FRRGRYREAHRHFDLALSLSPGNLDISLRVDRCRPYLPPPPPPPPPDLVVIAPAQPVIVVVPPRPRIAIFQFVVYVDPALAPPGSGDWGAENIACHFQPQYEVVDRGELFWYMGRLGMSVRDVLVNPEARRCLARALNVRFFVVGVVEQTASFNVTTHLM